MGAKALRGYRVYKYYNNTQGDKRHPQRSSSNLNNIYLEH
jgi:hypothetical protein